MAHCRLCAQQVFVYLLRACQPEVRKALVRESLDVLIPVLDKRMAAGAHVIFCDLRFGSWDTTLFTEAWPLLK